jgi:hypothetical protein
MIYPSKRPTGPPFLNELAELKNRPVPITPRQIDHEIKLCFIHSHSVVAVPPILYEPETNPSLSKSIHTSKIIKGGKVPDHRNMSVL